MMKVDEFEQKTWEGKKNTACVKIKSYLWCKDDTDNIELRLFTY